MIPDFMRNHISISIYFYSLNRYMIINILLTQISHFKTGIKALYMLAGQQSSTELNTK